MRRPIAKDDLEYVRLLATTLLLVLFVPMVLMRLWRHPHATTDRVLGSVVK